jgi:tetratricopeptide (TPR) repeat protein
MLKEALDWVNEAFTGDPEDVQTWPVLDPLSLHALTLVYYGDEAGIAEPTARLYSELGLLFQGKAHYGEAEPLIRRALVIGEASYGPHHPDIPTGLNNLAELLRVTNRLAEAEPLIRRALAIGEANGPNHPAVALYLNNLALVLVTTNRAAEAEPLMLRALAIRMDPDQFVKGSWKRVHPQLWNLLRKMLAFEPSERWESMRFVANKLRSLEGESRAIAKSVYLVPHPKKGGGEFKLQNEEAFYKRFYEIFLIKSPESERKFDSPQAQHLKLMNAIIAVLNYHEGNKPTSLDEFVEVHRVKGVSKDEFELFYDSFLETLRKFTDDESLIMAWSQLLRSVVNYMGAECRPNSSVTLPK